MLDKDVKKYIDQSVLCWLATCDKDLTPNVSPKEMFTCQGDDTLLIANIASPHSAKNIRENPRVCVSFVDVFVQKGYKLKGIASVIGKDDAGFGQKVKILTDLFTDRFPISSVIEIKVTSVNPIKAPSYLFFPETTEAGQTADAMATYQVRPI